VLFAFEAILPVLPYLLGLTGTTAVVVAAVIVGLTLLSTGTIVALLSGGSPVRMALRQLAIGYGGAGATYGLGPLFGTTVACPLPDGPSRPWKKPHRRSRPVLSFSVDIDWFGGALDTGTVRQLGLPASPP